MIAGFWLPFSLLFHLWVFLTPTYEEKWSLLLPLDRLSQSRAALYHSFLMVALVATSVLGFAIFTLVALPAPTSRLILILIFGFSLWKFMRPEA